MLETRERFVLHSPRGTCPRPHRFRYLRGKGRPIRSGVTKMGKGWPIGSAITKGGSAMTDWANQTQLFRNLNELAGAFDAAPVSGIEIGGIDEIPLVVDAEGEVGDLVALREEHLFVEGLHFEQFRTFFA